MPMPMLQIKRHRKARIKMYRRSSKQSILQDNCLLRFVLNRKSGLPMNASPSVRPTFAAITLNCGRGASRRERPTLQSRQITFPTKRRPQPLKSLPIALPSRVQRIPSMPRKRRSLRSRQLPGLRFVRRRALLRR